jgi:lipopolysaccharide export system protein LptA
MFGSTQRAKLLQLRQKTDQELIRLVTNRLQSATQKARQIVDGNVEVSSASAEKAHADTAALVSVISSASEGERIRLENELKELRRLLDQQRRQRAA